MQRKPKNLEFMKKIFLFAFIALVCAVSCSSDDDEPQAAKTSIVGRWVTIAFNTELGWTYAIVSPSHWEFKNDGTYETDYANYKSGKYTFNGTTLTLDGGFGETVKFSENGQEMEWGKWRYRRQ